MYRKSKKLIVWCLVVSLVLTQMLFTNTAFAAGSNRLSGLNRYETALRVSQNGWAAGSTQYAVLAYGEDFPDALSAAPLAKKFNAPILLTDKAALSAGVLEEINRVGAVNVFIVGGEGVVSAAVESALKAAGKTVTRLAGASRYETALKVAEQVGASDTVVVANGENYPDALSIAPIAAAKGWPILLTDTNAMDAAVKAYIGSKKAYVVGGSGAVSDAVLNSLSGAERVFGADRYATNVAIMTRFAAELNFDKVFLATGENFADALAGAAYAAKISAPVVLVGATMPAATESFIDSRVTSATEVIALGGSAVVPESAVTAVGGGTQDLAISAIAVTTQDGRNVKVTFNRPVAPLKRSDISIAQKNTQSVVGVDSVEMSADNMSVFVTLLEETSDETATNYGYIKSLETYVFTINADGRTLTMDYTRPGYMEGRVTSIDTDDNTITVTYGYEYDKDGNRTGYYTEDFEVLKDVNLDLFDVLGRTINVWYNRDYEVTKYTLQDETVKLDAIQLFPGKDSDQVKLVTEGKTYDLAKTTSSDYKKNLVMYKEGKEKSFNELAGTDNSKTVKYDFAKVVFDKSGDIVCMEIYEWADDLVVEKTEGTLVYAYGTEVDLDDYLVTKDGKTIAVEDLEEGDMLFYNNDTKVAEVYNKSVTGTIDAIYDASLSVNGTEYKAALEDWSGYVKFIDEEGKLSNIADTNTDTLKDNAEALQDGGDVTAFMNRYNKMVFVTGDLADLVKSTQYVLTVGETKQYDQRAKKYWNLDTFTTDKTEIDYDIADDDVNDGDDDMLVGTNMTNDTETVEIMKEQGTVTLDKDENVTGGIAIPREEVIRVKVDRDGDLAEVGLLNSITVNSAGGADVTTKFDVTDNYIKGYQIKSDTPVYLIEDYKGSDWDTDDIDVATYGDLAFDYIEQGNFYVVNNKVVAITVEKSDRKDDTTDYLTVVTGDISKVSGKDDQYKIPVVINGAKTSLLTSERVEVYEYVADADQDPKTTPDVAGFAQTNNYALLKVTSSYATKGKMFKVCLDENNVIQKIYSYENVAGLVEYTTQGLISDISTSDREVKLDSLEATSGNPLKLSDAAKLVIYDVQDSAVVKLTDLKEKDEIKVCRVENGSKYIEVIYRIKKKVD